MPTKIDLLRVATVSILSLSALTLPLTRVVAQTLPPASGQTPNSTTPQPSIAPADKPAPTTTPTTTPAATPTESPTSTGVGAPIATVSTKAELAFADYLARKGIKFYGSFKCSHCQDQKTLFGAAAAAKLIYVECDKDGANSQRQLCKDINIQYFPTWVINGKYVTGSKDLKDLAKLTGYKGSKKFKYTKESLKIGKK